MSKYDRSREHTDRLDYFALFQDLPESYMLFEAKEPYLITEVNKAREKLVERTRADAIGKPLFEVFPDTSKEYKRTGINWLSQQISRAVRTGKAVKLEPFRYDLINSQQKPQVHYWRSEYIPIKLSSKKVTHVLAHTQDVTAEHRAEERAAMTKERLDAALSIGKVGSWLWDVESNVTVGDKNLARIFHINYKQVVEGRNIQDLLDAVHPEDRQRVRKAIQRSLRERVVFDEEYRIILPNGRIRWILSRGKVENVDGRMLFPGVIVDITERRNLQAQVELARQQDRLNREAAKILQQRNEELEALATTKNEFVALASHQLRTPATAVKQYVGMVLQGYVGEVTETQKDMLEKAFESNERQIQIINQILNAARVDTGRLVMTPTRIDLRSLLEGIAADMHSDFERHKHSFSMKLPKQPVQVFADIGYLRMAIENILHNAVVYTPEGGSVRMDLVKSGTQCRLKISDTGVGIKKSDINKLFSKFSRIPNPLSFQAGGSGIGLFLAAEIVRLHSGAVTVDSKVNKGSTFAISLPLVQNKPQSTLNGRNQ